MLSSLQLKQIVAEARPLIERQLEIALQIAGLRTVVTEAGGDWSQLKALIKAQVQDEQADDPKRVERILEKADYAKIYADMLGLGRSNMNEENKSLQEGSEPIEAHAEQTVQDQGEGQHGAQPLPDISQADPDKPAEVETSAAPVAPGKRRWTFTDKAHADCLNPEQCGGFSNLGLCTACKTAAGVAA